MKLLVLSPEGEKLSCETGVVELPGAKGRFEVLPGHAPLLSSLSEGVLKYDCDGKRNLLHVSSGFVRVENDTVTVCVD